MSVTELLSELFDNKFCYSNLLLLNTKRIWRKCEYCKYEFLSCFVPKKENVWYISNQKLVIITISHFSNNYVKSGISKFSNILTEKQRDILEKYWCLSSIIYDPLKAGSIDGTDTEPHDKAIIRAQNSHYKPNCRVKGQPECTIFVSRLDFSTKEHDLKRHFSQYGKIIKCRLVEDIVTGKSKGYAFIEYETEREAARAYRHGHRTYLDGREMFVDMECERLLPGWIPRRLGGGFNGKKESGQIRFGGRDRPFRKPINLLTSKEILNSFDDRVKNFK